MADEQRAEQTTKLQFHYIKSPGYRETSCDGAIGGSTPQGKNWMALYSERTPIPRMVEYTVPTIGGADTVVFNEAESVPSNIEARQGVIRSVNCTIYMEIETAERIYSWLGSRIASLRQER